MRSSPPFSTISPSQCRLPWNVGRTRWSERSWSADTMRWPRPVSYTHLDVYKRQVVRLVAPFQQGKEPNMEFIREDCIYARQSVDRKDSISIETVSYTHLDVYKRQQLHHP